MYGWLVREAEEAPGPRAKRHTWRKAALAVCMILALSWFLYPLAFGIEVFFLVAGMIMILRAG